MSKTALEKKSTEALEKKGFNALERPTWLKEGDRRGTENITTNDVRLPALRLAQSMSPEVKRQNPERFIEGLREGEFFNSLTRENYGEGPFRVVIINYLGHRNVEFDPVDRNKVVDFNVPDGDPRTAFRDEKDPTSGQLVRKKPAATLFYDFLGYVVPKEGAAGEVMTFSLKGTQIKKAKDLNSWLNRVGCVFSVFFELKSVPEKRGTFDYYGWQFGNPAGWVDEATGKICSEMFDALKTKNIEVERENEEPETPASAVAGDDIPF